MGVRRVAATLCVTLLVCGSLDLSASSDVVRLVDAVKRGDQAAVRVLLLEKGIDVNAAESDGTASLHWAVHRNDPEMVDLLLGAGARVETATDLGVTPLFLACENGNAVVAERLLRAGASTHKAALANGVTPLMMASRTGNVKTVKALIARGADVNATETARSQTALMWAAAQGHSEVVSALAQAGSDVHARSAVSKAIVSRGNGLVSADIAEMRLGGFTPLLFAAAQGRVETARALLAAGARVDDAAADGATPLVVAAYSDHVPMAVLLLQQGANVEAGEAGYSALHAAVLRGNPGLVAALLAGGANPNTPVSKGTPVKRLSKEYVFEDGWVGATSLFLAAQFAEADIMRLLVAAGGDPLFRLRGTSVLMAAAGVDVGPFGRRGRQIDPGEIELALLQNEDERPLMNSGLKAVQLSLELGIDVNLANDAGDTVLHGAAAQGFRSVVQLLIQAGAKPDIQNKNGQTPLMVAERGSHNNVADMLRGLGEGR